jgi:hypothetical protein
MGRRAKELTASDVVAARDDAKCTGFFDRHPADDHPRVVVLAVSEGKPRLCGVEEFTASTVDMLVERARDAGWELGGPERVEELCQPVWSRKK